MILYQVNRIISKKQVLNYFLRCAHTQSQRVSSYAKVLFPLQSRALLKISGKDASVFLQGLITNDMRHFEEGSKTMYAMFLNNKGRVQYDTLIYQWGDDSFLLECDNSVITALQKHLNLFKLRRQVKLEDMNQSLKLWALISPSSSVPDLKTDTDSHINIYKDPRLADLGNRIVSKVALKATQIAETIGKDIVLEDNEDGYKYLRYRLGVCEGASELPPGSCFPLEVNCDYLHGVSFHKGCYVGQELTARIHHTGVIRKRIMPIKFTDDVLEDLGKDTVILAKDNPKLKLGKLRAFLYDYGLGLVRTKETLDAKVLNIGNYSAEPLKPNWWPEEAPKDKFSSKSDEKLET